MSTPNMGMVLPVVSSTPGPLYASENNQAFLVIDGHDHSPGNGVPVPTAGISINADLAFNSFNATLLRTTRFVNQGAPLALASDVVCLYGAGGNLYWNNSIGQAVQITAGAALNAASIGGIGGDYTTSTASVFYTSAQSTFTFWSAANTSASIDGGPLTIRNNTANSFGVTISAFAGLTANYNLVLPAALPASTKILTVDASGNIADVYDVDNTSIILSSNNLSVNLDNTTLYYNGSNVAIKPQSVTQGLLAPRTTGTAVGAGGVAVSITTGLASKSTTSYSTIDDGSTNLSITITTTGRPVWVGFMPTMGSDSQSVIQLLNTGGSNNGCSAFLAFLRNASIISSHNLEMAVANIAGSTPTDLIGIPPTAFYCLDMVAAGTYTYTAQAKVGSTAAMVITFNNMQLVAYEI